MRWGLSLFSMGTNVYLHHRNPVIIWCLRTLREVVLHVRFCLQDINPSMCCLGIIMNTETAHAIYLNLLIVVV